MTTFDRALIKAFSGASTQVAAPVHRATPSRAVRTAAAARRTVLATHREDKSAAIADSAVATPPSPLAPLSAFAPEPETHELFRPLLEVDRLAWPPACEQMLARARRAWDRFAEHLNERIAWGQKCIALVGSHRGEGRTTVGLAAAKHLVARGLRPLLVDADFENPSLARICGLSAQTGWGDVLRGDLPLGEAVVAAIDDGVAVMPWRGAAVNVAELTNSLRAATSFRMLRDHFDIVILDTMPFANRKAAADFAAFAEAIHLDAVYLVRDARWTSRKQAAAAMAMLTQAGLTVEGLIDNFVVPGAGGDDSDRTDDHSEASPTLASCG